MVRVKTGTTRRRRHKKILKQAKGYRGARSRRFRDAKQAVQKSLQYAYAHRRQRKRQFRRLWVLRIHSALEDFGLSYAQFINGLKRANVGLDRKMLAEIAVNDADAFDELVTIARDALATTSPA
ncbi:MAG: 50S ribosomal protein L20 [bacterium JZ-2024 1]